MCIRDRFCTDRRMYGKIEENYEIFVKTQDLSGLMAAYQEALVNQDQQVRVLDVDKRQGGRLVSGVMWGRFGLYVCGVYSDRRNYSTQCCGI